MYLEDVFYLFERNKLIYSKKEDRDKELIRPITIGPDRSFVRKLTCKCYIYPGEECAICLDPIITKKDCYLTECGHVFHRFCVFKMFESKWNRKPFSLPKCPICRRGLGDLDLSIRYNNDYQKKKEIPFFMDQLENFWLTKEYIMPHFCNNIKNPHYLGMKKNCEKCREYCMNG